MRPSSSTVFIGVFVSIVFFVFFCKWFILVRGKLITNYLPTSGTCPSCCNKKRSYDVLSFLQTNLAKFLKVLSLICRLCPWKNLIVFPQPYKCAPWSKAVFLAAEKKGGGTKGFLNKFDCLPDVIELHSFANLFTAPCLNFLILQREGPKTMRIKIILSTFLLKCWILDKTL